MKISTGFVSNSSSSSFTCNICGYEISGMDLSLEDIEMFQCQEGHVACLRHMSKENRDKCNELDIDPYDEEAVRKIEEVYGECPCPEDLYYELPSAFCPCCNFEKVAKDDLLSYLLRMSDKTCEEHEETMRNGFTTYKDFLDFVRG